MTTSIMRLSQAEQILATATNPKQTQEIEAMAKADATVREEER